MNGPYPGSPMGPVLGARLWSLLCAIPWIALGGAFMGLPLAFGLWWWAS